MCPEAQLTGLHSRSEQLVELTRAYDRGRASWSEVEARLREETSEVVKLQDKLGFEPISDGALGWQDPLRPLTKSLKGVTSGTRYSRWFDTNTFYQKPAVTGKISANDFELKDFVQTELLPKDRKWKVNLPGPYTFSELSEDRYYGDRNELLRDIARAEREILKELAESGVSVIQLSEPSLVYRPYREEDLAQAEVGAALDAINDAVKGLKVEVCLHTFFGDPKPIFRQLVELPVDSVGIDLYETDPTRLDLKSSKKLVLGIVDARGSHIEDPEWIAKTALLVRKRTDAPDVVLAPNSDLKFLPRTTADRKLTALAEAAKIAGRIE